MDNAFITPEAACYGGFCSLWRYLNSWLFYRAGNDKLPYVFTPTRWLRSASVRGRSIRGLQSESQQGYGQ